MLIAKIQTSPFAPMESAPSSAKQILNALLWVFFVTLLQKNVLIVLRTNIVNFTAINLQTSASDALLIAIAHSTTTVFAPMECADSHAQIIANVSGAFLAKNAPMKVFVWSARRTVIVPAPKYAPPGGISVWSVSATQCVESILGALLVLVISSARTIAPVRGLSASRKSGNAGLAWTGMILHAPIHHFPTASRIFALSAPKTSTARNLRTVREASASACVIQIVIARNLNIPSVITIKIAYLALKTKIVRAFRQICDTAIKFSKAVSNAKIHLIAMEVLIVMSLGEIFSGIARIKQFATKIFTPPYLPRWTSQSLSGAYSPPVKPV